MVTAKLLLPPQTLIIFPMLFINNERYIIVFIRLQLRLMLSHIRKCFPFAKNLASGS